MVGQARCLRLGICLQRSGGGVGEGWVKKGREWGVRMHVRWCVAQAVGTWVPGYVPASSSCPRLRFFVRSFRLHSSSCSPFRFRSVHIHPSLVPSLASIHLLPLPLLVSTPSLRQSLRIHPMLRSLLPFLRCVRIFSSFRFALHSFQFISSCFVSIPLNARSTLTR